MLAQAECNLTEREFRRLSDMVYQHCKINLHDGKMSLVQARIAKRLRATDLNSVSAYLDFVEADKSGAEFTTLIDAISTNLTSFFRENKHFQHLSKVLLPGLLERRRKSGDRRLRCWSAGCSSGEEPYTLAITLMEAIEAAGQSPAEWDVKVLATDISTRVLGIAREGVYEKARVESVPPAIKNKYFRPERQDGEAVFRVADALRASVRFRHLNLMQEPWPFDATFDFIFCRNVMIYFDKPTQEKLVGRYWGCLESGGLLFTGHSESLTGINHKFKYVEPTIYGKV
ncbi:MAG TPA: protein-glutamate O-methyltransferase [Tepidisphaeraceae bacterium]|jgi:chemotaxis protein methyltransferase CheR|nr:protein-glutamate O-methyltransferase [Tepidisphaeraceae bacterium]